MVDVVHSSLMWFMEYNVGLRQSVDANLCPYLYCGSCFAIAINS